jgi:hypothetical protein
MNEEAEKLFEIIIKDLMDSYDSFDDFSAVLTKAGMENKFIKRAQRIWNKAQKRNKK